MYAIINNKSKKFVYGTDFRYNPAHQRLSNDRMIVYESILQAKMDMSRRKCGKCYSVVEIKIEIVKEISDNFVYDYICEFKRKSNEL